MNDFELTASSLYTYVIIYNGHVSFTFGNETFSSWSIMKENTDCRSKERYLGHETFQWVWVFNFLDYVEVVKILSIISWLYIWNYFSVLVIRGNDGSFLGRGAVSLSKVEAVADLETSERGGKKHEI